MRPHDNAYQHVFSHPRAVADLLRGLVREDWVAQLDYQDLVKSGQIGGGRLPAVFPLVLYNGV